MFTVSIIEGGTMHHTTDPANSDRADLARSAVGAFLGSDLRRELGPTDLTGVVRAPANVIRTGADKTALVEILEER